MEIYEILKSIDHDEFYLNRYIKFIEYCLIKNNYNDNDNSYFESHHIAPKSLFPRYTNFNENKWNKLVLTARQHYIAHYLLAKSYGGGMWLAFNMMNNANKYNKNFTDSYIPKGSIIYQNAKIKSNKIISEKAKGRKVSDETRNKMSESHKKREYKRAICPHCDKEGGLSQIKRYHFDNCKTLPENKDKRKIRQVTCQHCNKTGLFNSMARWHFDKCKENPNISRELLENRVSKGECGYCGIITDILNLHQHHLDNCKHNPNISKNAIERKEKRYKSLSDTLKGRIVSYETREKLSKINKGKLKPQKIVTCPYCNKSGGKQNMTRYHFDNCKDKNKYITTNND